MGEYREKLERILFYYVNGLIHELSDMTQQPLSLSMLRYLDAIYMHQPITPSELAIKVGVSRPATTKMIKRLMEQGMLTKVYTTQRNSYTVSLTKHALDIYSVTQRADRELIDLLEHHLHLSTIEHIEDKLKRIIQTYEQKDV